MTTTTRVRMSKEGRREQLLEIGVRLLATHPLEELSIELLADHAGISRGLLYHYFGNKQDFHVAVVRRAVADIYAITAPMDLADPTEQLMASLAAYLDYVTQNHAGYLSLVRAAQGGNEELQTIYEDARRALTDRLFERIDATEALGVQDTPATRLLARSWAALAEDAVLAWLEDPAGLSREVLLERIAAALPALILPAT
ncbi:TetR/AcrR family transcriptional regulator [Nocardioides terrisoli]|uniref:TetR/AcrR family transcriptional regulator n=1 Tax=Nocardioides terrisoli TaxID=3388267 RepID=UPI00287B692B|nr:TetR/AcrR family transcriptional regulator [Nocardioides marmorisolisilvae]